MPSLTLALIERPDDLTAEWLTAAVGAGEVAEFSFERIGTGQMSECYRIALDLRRRSGRTGLGRVEGRGRRRE